MCGKKTVYFSLGHMKAASPCSMARVWGVQLWSRRDKLSYFWTVVCDISFLKLNAFSGILYCDGGYGVLEEHCIHLQGRTIFSSFGFSTMYPIASILKVKATVFFRVMTPWNLLSFVVTNNSEEYTIFIFMVKHPGLCSGMWYKYFGGIICPSSVLEIMFSVRLWHCAGPSDM